jgi:hypothetical protein
MGAANHEEQRWSQRRSVELEVEVIDKGQSLGVCTSRDVGLGGVFLDCDPGIVDDPQAMDLKLVFHLPERNEDREYTVSAQLVRMNSEGVGLRFDNFDTYTFRALQEIMRYTLMRKTA